MLRTIINSLTIASGAALGQLIGLLVLPILVRIYDPVTFGTFSILFTAVTVLSSVASTRYEQAIVLTRSNRAAAALTQLAFLVAFVVCLIAAILLAFASSRLDALFKIALGDKWLLVAALAFPVSVLATLTMVAVRYDCYGLISVSRTAKVCLSAAIQAVVGLSILSGVGGLIAGEFMGNATTAAGCLVALTRSHKRASRRFDWLWTKVLWREMLVVARKFAVFPKINTPHVLVNGLVGWVTVLVISMFFSAQELGFYYLMQRIALAPASFAGQAVSQVYYREGSTASRSEGNFYRPLLRVIMMQLAIGVPFALILFFFGSEIFSLAFGAEWRRAGRLAEIFAPYVALHLVLASLAPTTIIAGRQMTMFILSVIQSFIFVVGFFLGSIGGGDIDSGVRVAALISALYLLGMIAWFVKLSYTSASFSNPLNLL
ncbi:conserved membrane hypothetical protein [Gammaproteobacteria bacterium]